MGGGESSGLVFRWQSSDPIVALGAEKIKWGCSCSSWAQESLRVLFSSEVLLRSCCKSQKSPVHA